MKKLQAVQVGLITLIFVLSITGMVAAGSVPTPTEPPAGVTIVQAINAKTLIEQNKVQVFDMRKALNYGKGHISGATSLPYEWTKRGHPSERTGEFNMSKLPADKNTALLFHSDGPTGWKSYYASKAAKEAGYKNVMWMRDGYSTWTESGYPVKH